MDLWGLCHPTCRFLITEAGRAFEETRSWLLRCSPRRGTNLQKFDSVPSASRQRRSCGYSKRQVNILLFKERCIREDEREATCRVETHKPSCEITNLIPSGADLQKLPQRVRADQKMNPPCILEARWHLSSSPYFLLSQVPCVTCHLTKVRK
jgi:hypothetical protein